MEMNDKKNRGERSAGKRETERGKENVEGGTLEKKACTSLRRRVCLSQKLIIADAAGNVTISRQISKAEFVPLVEKHSSHAIRGS